MDDFSQKLRKYRLARQLSLNDLAQAMGVSKPTIWAWEQARSRPRPERHAALAEILQVPVEAFVRPNPTIAEESEAVPGGKEKVAEAFVVELLQEPLDVSARTRFASAKQAEVVRECKQRMGEAFGLDPSAIRIRIEL